MAELPKHVLEIKFNQTVYISLSKAFHELFYNGSYTAQERIHIEAFRDMFDVLSGYDYVDFGTIVKSRKKRMMELDSSLVVILSKNSHLLHIRLLKEFQRELNSLSK